MFGAQRVPNVNYAILKINVLVNVECKRFTTPQPCIEHYHGKKSHRIFLVCIFYYLHFPIFKVAVRSNFAFRWLDVFAWIFCYNPIT